MDIHRISVKYFLTDPAGASLEALVPVFHRWIQQSKVPGLLIDVADYRHMVNGPGVVLVGHDVDYSLDLADGRPGMRCTQKRTGGAELNAMLKRAVEGARAACRLLEQEPEFAGKLRFNLSEMQIVLADRLRAPNSEESFRDLRAAVSDVLARLDDKASARIEREPGDDRRCLTLRVTI